MFTTQGWQWSARLLALASVLLFSACGGGGGGGGGAGGSSGAASGIVYQDGATFTLPAVDVDSSGNITNGDALLQALAVPTRHPVKYEWDTSSHTYKDATLFIQQEVSGEWTFTLRDPSNNVLVTLTNTPTFYNYPYGAFGVSLGRHSGGGEVYFIVNKEGHLVNSEAYASGQSGGKTFEFSNGLIDAWGSYVQDALVSLAGTWTGKVATDSINGGQDDCHDDDVTLTIDSAATVTLTIDVPSPCSTFSQSRTWSQLLGNNTFVEDELGYYIGLETDAGDMDIYVDNYQHPTQITELKVSSSSSSNFILMETGVMTKQ